MKTEYDGGEPSSADDALMQEFHGFQEQQQQHHMPMCLREDQQKQQLPAQYTAGHGGLAVIGGVHEVAAAAGGGGGGGGGGCQHGFNSFPSESTTTVLPWNIPSLHSPTIIPPTAATTASSNNVSVSNTAIHQDHGRLYPPPPPPPPMPPYADFYASRRASAGFQFGYEGGFFPSDPLGLAGLYLGGGGGGGGGGPEAFFRSGGGGLSVGTSPFSALQSEFGKMTAQEIMDAKALAASKSHSEAERRRRERINAHLAKLRSLLPSTTKTDKASLLAEVIQHVKELKRQTSDIIEAESPVPTESDELTVDAASDEDGKLVVKASMCCDDRSDLLTELIKALKALRLRALKAEITTLGGRVKNVLVITGEDESEAIQHHSITSIQDALKAVMDRTASDDPSAAAGSSGGGSSLKRQRTTSLSSILENRST